MDCMPCSLLRRKPLRLWRLGVALLLPLRPGGGEGRGEVEDSRAPADTPTSPSHRCAMGPSLSPKARRGNFVSLQPGQLGQCLGLLLVAAGRVQQ